MKLSTNQYLLIGLGVAAFIGGGILLLKKPNNVSDENIKTEPNAVSPNAKYSVGTKLTAKNESVNVRSTASTSGSVVRTVLNGDLIGTVISFTKDSNGYFWYKVNDGYVREDVVSLYVFKEPAYMIGTSVQPSGASATIKLTPFNNANTLNAKATGYLGTVISTAPISSDGYSWYKISLIKPIASTSGAIYTSGYVKVSDVKMFNK